MGYTFKNFTTEALTANDLNVQFGKIENKLGNIKNSDISTDARITSNKLLDRYSAVFQTVIFNNSTWGGTFVFQDQSDMSLVTEARIYPILPDKRAFLVGISGYVTTYSAGTGNGVIAYTIDGVTFASNTIEETGPFAVRAGFGTSAFNGPILAISNGQYIGLKFGRTATGGTTSATSITVTFTYKIELTA